MFTLYATPATSRKLCISTYVITTFNLSQIFLWRETAYTEDPPENSKRNDCRPKIRPLCIRLTPERHRRRNAISLRARWSGTKFPGLYAAWWQTKMKDAGRPVGISFPVWASIDSMKNKDGESLKTSVVVLRLHAIAKRTIPYITMFVQDKQRSETNRSIAHSFDELLGRVDDPLETRSSPY